MIKELQIRPFARPLLVWIAGIMLQTVFSCCTYSWVLLLLPVIILTTAGLALRGQEHQPHCGEELPRKRCQVF